MRKRLRLIRLLRRYGIKYPIIAYEEAEREGVELAILAAVLEQETGGGRNVFGHDRGPDGEVIWHGREGEFKVTKRRYLQYRRFRDLTRPRRMQGVGPMQLTWYSFQDEADREGGCWKPRPNIRIGARILARLIKRYGDGPNGLRQVFRAYNGSYEYADQVIRRVEKWRKRLAPPPLVPKPWLRPESLHPSLHAAFTASMRRGFTNLGTYADKPGSHGLRPAFAFDLGHKSRFNFLGWGYLKARRHSRWLAKNADELGIRYILLGKKMLHCRSGFKPEPFADPDGSHAFHIHVNGHDPRLSPCPNEPL